MVGRFNWTPMSQVVRRDPLGPQRLNALDANTRLFDNLQRVEHLANGEHNALEVPWVLGHVDGTTGYLFDTDYGGGTLANPATGAFTVSVASGVLTLPAASVMANVSDSAIETKPHLITWEGVSGTSIKVRIRELSSTLGVAGNTWAEQNRDFDIGIHAPPKAVEASLLNATTTKVKRDFLTESAADWNARAKNTALAYNAARLEHKAGGGHDVNRIAKAVWWGKPTTGPSFSTTLSEGIKALSYVSLGVVELETDATFALQNKMACFCEAQPGTADEIVVVNGRGFATNKFRFYIYRYSTTLTGWERVDRPFFAAMFGEV